MVDKQRSSCHAFAPPDGSPGPDRDGDDIRLLHAPLLPPAPAAGPALRLLGRLPLRAGRPGIRRRTAGPGAAAGAAPPWGGAAADPAVAAARADGGADAVGADRRRVTLPLPAGALRRPGE